MRPDLLWSLANDARSAAPAPADAASLGSAREWLALLDSQDWQQSWRLAGGLFNPAMLDRLLTDPQGQLTPLRGSKLWQLAALNLWLSEQGI